MLLLGLLLVLLPVERILACINLVSTVRWDAGLLERTKKNLASCYFQIEINNYCAGQNLVCRFSVFARPCVLVVFGAGP